MTDRPTFKDHDYFMKDKTEYNSRAVFQEHVRHTNDKTRELRDDTEDLQAQTEVLHQEMRDYHGELDAVIEGNLIQTKVDDRVEQKYNELDEVYNTQLNGLTAQLAQTNSFVSELSKGTKGAFATFSDLESAFPTGTEGLYVLESDGYWYYWNGNEWAQGALFQSLEINDFLIAEGQEWEVEA